MNFSASFVLKSAFVLVAPLLVAGCGARSSESAYADGQVAYARRDFVRAVREFTESVTLCPKNTDAWVMLAQTQMALADIPAARQAVQKAALCASGQTNIVTCGESDIIELAGQLAYHARDFVAARAAYTALTAAALPNTTRARGFCGLAVLDMEAMDRAAANVNLARARVNLLQALRLDGNNAAVRYHLGHLYHYSYNYTSAALDQFMLYARLETQDDDRRQRVQTRIIPELKDALARAAAERPNSPRTRDALLKAGDAALKSGKMIATAVEAYSRALAARPGDTAALDGLIRALKKAGDAKSAAVYQKYRDTLPKRTR